MDLQGPQGEAGTGGGGSITIDDTPKSGSSNAVSSGGVYDALKMPGQGFISTQVGFSYASGSSSVSIGYQAAADGGDSVAAGPFSAAGAFVSLSLGAYSKAVSDKTTAVGAMTVAAAFGSSVFGAGGYICDEGVTAINAGGDTADAKSTQLYLIPAGSDMANLYTGGAAGLGFVVLDHLSGSVVARGTISLASICTQHTSDFSPIDVTSIQLY